MITRHKAVHPRQRTQGFTSPTHTSRARRSPHDCKDDFSMGISEVAVEERLERGESRSTSAESRSHRENHRNSRASVAVLWLLRGRQLMQADKVCDEDVPDRLFSDGKTIQGPDEKDLLCRLSLCAALVVCGSSKKESKKVVIAGRLLKCVSIRYTNPATAGADSAAWPARSSFPGTEQAES